MGKTTLPIDVDCHVFLLFSFERMKFDLLVLCVFCSSCWFHSGAVPNFSWTWDVGIAEQYHKPPWWWLHLNTSRCSSFPLAANLGKFTLITSNHFFEKLPQSICAPISRPLKDSFSTPLCVWWSWKGCSHAFAWYCSAGFLLTTNRDETNHPHTHKTVG